MKVLGLIPARGGSVRLPRKNILECAGKPLIAWTIEQAQKAKLIDSVWVSTEDAEITQIAKDWGANVLYRPHKLATDDTPSQKVVEHAQSMLTGFDYVCLLQPTSPCRLPSDIDDCIRLAFEAGEAATMCNDKVNGAVYVCQHWPRWWRNFLEMPVDRSIDIDTLDDLKQAEAILNGREIRATP